MREHGEWREGRDDESEVESGNGKDGGGEGREACLNTGEETGGKGDGLRKGRKGRCEDEMAREEP